MRDRALQIWQKSTFGYYQRSAATIAKFLIDKARYRQTPVQSSFEPRAPLKIYSSGADSSKLARKAIPKIIWIYWHQEKPTRIVEIVRCQLLRLNPTYELRFVSRYSIRDWLPEFREPTSEISIQHFSDILRLDLLERYGGVWCDASLIFFAPLCQIFDGQLASVSSDVDLFAFYIERFSSRLDPPIIENWFLAAPPASPVIQAWRQALEPMRQGGEQVFSKYLESQPDYVELKQDMLLEDYLVSHIALQSALSRMRQYALLLERAEDESFALQVGCHWNAYELIRQLLAQPYSGQLPRLVKLSGYDRHLADLILRRGIEDPRSLLGRFSTQY